MNSIQSRLSEYPKSSYLLVLSPDEDVTAEIVELKQLFANKFDFPAATKSKPHLTLLHFVQHEILETAVVQKLQKFSDRMSPFDIDLAGFGSFPGHTIYVDVKTKDPVITMVKNLRGDVQRLVRSGDKETKPQFVLKPHITIARNLLPAQFEKSWKEWEKKKFSARFRVGGMLLLKKNGSAAKYEKVSDFQFLGRTVIQYAQGLLF